MGELQKKLRKRYTYNPVTGEMRNKIENRRAGVIKGEIAGSLNGGIRFAFFNGRRYSIGRLIILYIDGYLPDFTGFKDGNPDNTRYENILVSEKRVTRSRGKEYNVKPKVFDVHIENPLENIFSLIPRNIQVSNVK